jgi:hypothetical protein
MEDGRSEGEDGVSGGVFWEVENVGGVSASGED